MSLSNLINQSFRINKQPWLQYLIFAHSIINPLRFSRVSGFLPDIYTLDMYTLDMYTLDLHTPDLHTDGKHISEYGMTSK